MKQAPLYCIIIVFLLIICGCARKDVKPGETMFTESQMKFDPEDSTLKMPFDIPKAEVEATETNQKDFNPYLK